MDRTCANVNLSSNSSKMQDESDNCADDKLSVYQTAITAAYIKQEPFDAEDEGGTIQNYANVKYENIDDSTVIVQGTELMMDTKQYYPKCCEECGEEYDLYCLKCLMLIRIFDSNNPSPSHSRDRWTLPKKFIDIRETPSGVGTVALRDIPKGVVFGPFEGLNSSKDGVVSKWKLKNHELACAKDPKRLNWMQYIRRADRSCPQNLTTFQYEDALYYRSDCDISIGDELLVYLDSDNEENMIEDSYLKPQVCERLDDTYGCTLCCVGFKSLCHLAAHNSSCPEKRNRNDFCKEIIQCALCKIYLDKKEYSDSHIDQCCESNRKCPFRTCYKPTSDDHLLYHEDMKPIKCESCDTEFWNVRSLARHEKVVHAMADETYYCYKCKYRTRNKYALDQHLARMHDGPKLFACALCPYRTMRNSSLKRHVATHNNDETYKCYKCDFRTRRNRDFKRHLKVHNEPNLSACTLCPYKTTKKSALKRHIAIHNRDKPFRCDMCPKIFNLKSNLTRHSRNIHTEAEKMEYKCPQCPFETKYKANMKLHVNTHNVNGLFQCSKCDFSAHHKGHVTRHIKRLHGTKVKEEKDFIKSDE